MGETAPLIVPPGLVYNSRGRAWKLSETVYKSRADAVYEARRLRIEEGVNSSVRVVGKGSNGWKYLPDQTTMKGWFFIFIDVGVAGSITGGRRSRRIPSPTVYSTVPAATIPTPVPEPVPTTVISTTLTSEQFEAAEKLWDGSEISDRRRIAVEAGVNSEFAILSFRGCPEIEQEKLARVMLPDMFSSAERRMESVVEEEEVEEIPMSVVPAQVITIVTHENMLKYIPTALPYYVPQTIGNTNIEDLFILRNAVLAKKNILLTGETGLGKTTALLRVAAELKLPYRSVNLNGGITVEDLVGQWSPEPSGGFTFRDGILTEFIKYGGLLVAEEINAANPEVLFVLHSVLDDTRGLTLTALGGKFLIAGGGAEGSTPERYHFCFAATMNPSYAGTQELNIALRDRFQVVLEFAGKNIPKIIKNKKLVNIYNKLHASILDGTISGIVSLRGLKQYIENIALFGPDIAKEIFLEKFFTAQHKDVVRELLQAEGL